MPIVQITLLPGRAPSLVSECARQVALTIQKTLAAPLESIRVTVNEVPATHWVVGDRTRAEIDTAGAAKITEDTCSTPAIQP